MKLFRRICIVLLAGLGLGLGAVSCVFTDETASEPEHVLLAYLGGDNNLSDFAYEKLFGLRDGWGGSSRRRIVAYMDIAGSGASLVEITKDGSGAKTIRNIVVYGSENSASADVFSRVIGDVVRMYPAKSYGLLVFSHASGWLPEGTLSDPYKPLPESMTRSAVVDGKSEMGLRELAAAIPAGIFDYIAFEMCFMAGIEVAYELKDKTPLILASSAEIVDPGFTPVYPSATGKLLSGDLVGFGRSVSEYVLATYSESELKRSATYSAIRTAGLGALAEFVRDNCDFTRAVDVTQVQKFDRYSYRLFFDFEDYHSRLLETEAQRAELSKLVDGCIAWKQATTTFMTQKPGYNGFEITNHSGLTSYIMQEQFPYLNHDYARLRWARDTRQ